MNLLTLLSFDESGFFSAFNMNTLLEFLGLIALIGALWLQRRELRLQREQLKSQTEEFKKTSSAQEKYAEAMIYGNGINNLRNYLNLLNQLSDTERRIADIKGTQSNLGEYNILISQKEKLVDILEKMGPVENSRKP